MDPWTAEEIPAATKQLRVGDTFALGDSIGIVLQTENALKTANSAPTFSLKQQSLVSEQENGDDSRDLGEERVLKDGEIRAIMNNGEIVIWEAGQDGMVLIDRPLSCGDIVSSGMDQVRWGVVVRVRQSADVAFLVGNRIERRVSSAKLSPVEGLLIGEWVLSPTHRAVGQILSFDDLSILLAFADGGVCEIAGDGVSGLQRMLDDGEMVEDIHDFVPGLEVIAKKWTLRSARWIRGGHHERSNGRATVLHVEASGVHVNWTIAYMDDVPPETISPQSLVPLALEDRTKWRAMDTALIQSWAGSLREDDSRSSEPSERLEDGVLVRRRRRRRRGGARQAPVAVSGAVPDDRARAVQILRTYTRGVVLWQDGTVGYDIPSVHLEPVVLLDTKAFFPGDVVEMAQEKRAGVVLRNDVRESEVLVRWITKNDDLKGVPLVQDTVEQSTNYMLSRGDPSFGTPKDAIDLVSDDAPHGVNEVVPAFDLQLLDRQSFRPGDIVVHLREEDRLTTVSIAPHALRTFGCVIRPWPDGRIHVRWADGTHTVEPFQLIMLAAPVDTPSEPEPLPPEALPEAPPPPQQVLVEQDLPMVSALAKVIPEIQTPPQPHTPSLLDLSSQPVIPALEIVAQTLRLAACFVDEDETLVEQKTREFLAKLHLSTSQPLETILSSPSPKKSIFLTLASSLTTSTIASDIAPPPSPLPRPFPDLSKISAEPTTTTTTTPRAGPTPKAIPASRKPDSATRLVSADFLPSDFGSDYLTITRANAPPVTPLFAKAYRREIGALRRALPPGILVQTFANDMTALRCVIVGPRGTPYTYSPFYFDILLPGGSFPGVAPLVHFHCLPRESPNPNLHKDGSVCLSLLGDAWEPWKSTVLQILVSIQGLVLVDKPYFCEEELEATKDDPIADRKAKRYNLNVLLSSVENATLLLTSPPPSLEHIIRSHFSRCGKKYLSLLEALASSRETRPSLRSGPAAAGGGGGAAANPPQNPLTKPENEQDPLDPKAQVELDHLIDLLPSPLPTGFLRSLQTHITALKAVLP